MSERWDPANSKHSEFRTVLRILGPGMVSLGLIFMAVGLVNFFSAFGGGGPPRLFWCLFVGAPLLAIGSAISKFAYLGPVARYMADEVAPVGKDVVNYMVDGTKSSMREMAAAVAEGFRSNGPNSAEPTEEQPPHVKVRCQTCRVLNDEAAKFCNQCGAQI